MTTDGTGPRRPIAVVGATGLQGGATARALLDAKIPVRALVRRPDSDAARALAEFGADLVAADLDDPEGLRAAFTGVDGVFAMTTPGPDRRTDREVTHGHTIADAAAAAGVPHVVYSSVGGAERHTRRVCFVVRSNSSRNGRSPSSDAPSPLKKILLPSIVRCTTSRPNSLRAIITRPG